MFEGKRIMIVEDSATVRYQLNLIFSKTGAVIVETANGIGMFNMVEEYGKCVDLIIMDVTLKYENGLDLVEKLRQIDRYKNIPVLVLTEHAAMDYVLKAKLLGVAGYLKKPIQKDELLDRVKKALEDVADNNGDETKQGYIFTHNE